MSSQCLDNAVQQDMATEDAALWSAWIVAAKRPELVKQLTRLYKQIDRCVSAYPDECLTCGRCCRFEEYGHRLYITGLELAWFSQRYGSYSTGRPGPLITGGTRPERGVCPLLQGVACTVHAIRPMGCRLFNCRVYADRQSVDHEMFLRRIRRLHDKEDLPYVYMNWSAALQRFPVLRES